METKAFSNAVNVQLTILMYHYVRDLKHSRFPDLKALQTDQFRGQISYLQKYYQFVSAGDLLDAIVSGEPLPPRALLLTFDDAYLDHFTNVFPILNEQRVPACFFPPAKCILENQVLDVNKIHFILASVADKSKLLELVFKLIEEHRKEFDVETCQSYRSQLATPSRFDSKEVVLIKRLLQRELPENLRRMIVDLLFRRYVTSDEAALSRELYMSMDQIRCLRRNGMYIGAHGYNHHWLDTLSRVEQEREIDCSLEFLRQAGSSIVNWIMCYPYGAYNSSLLDLLTQRGCKIGLTTQVGIADLQRDPPLRLPRLDTNDLPKKGEASPSHWTIQSMAQMHDVTPSKK